MPVHTYVVGDVHLRECAGPFMQFLRRLQQRQPARLVILGDLCEYWLETEVYVRRYRPLLDLLRALADAGWRLDFVLGNREFSVAERLLHAAQLTAHWPHLDLTFGERTLRIIHGDRLCHDPAYHMMAAVLRSFMVRILYRVVPALVQDGIVCIVRALSKGSDRHDNLYEQRIFVDPRRIAAHKRHAQIIIAGHIHDTWHKTVRGVELYLVGDWPQNIGHWIEIDVEGRIRQCRDEFEE